MPSSSLHSVPSLSDPSIPSSARSFPSTSIHQRRLSRVPDANDDYHHRTRPCPAPFLPLLFSLPSFSLSYAQLSPCSLLLHREPACHGRRLSSSPPFGSAPDQPRCRTTSRHRPSFSAASPFSSSTQGDKLLPRTSRRPLPPWTSSSPPGSPSPRCARSSCHREWIPQPRI